MRNRELVEFVAALRGCAMAAAEPLVNATVDALASVVLMEGAAKVSGLGTFEVVATKPRRRVVPGVGELPPRGGHKVRFRPCERLRDQNRLLRAAEAEAKVEADG